MTRDDLNAAFPHCKILSEEPPKIFVNPKKLVNIHVLNEKINDSGFGLTAKINSSYEAAVRLNERHSLYEISWGSDADGKVNSLILSVIKAYCEMCGDVDWDCDFADVADMASDIVKIAKKMKR